MLNKLIRLVQISFGVQLSLPSSQGGLAMRDIKMMNRALLAKNVWRFCQNQSNITAGWAKCRFGSSAGELSFNLSSQSSFIGKGLVKNGDLVESAQMENW